MNPKDLRRLFEDDGFHVLGRDYRPAHRNDVTGEEERITEGGIFVRGDLSATFYKPGETYTKVLGRNIVVNSGLDNIARAIAAGYPSYTSYAINDFAIGSNKQAESASLTALGTLVYNAAPTVSFANTGKIIFTLALLDGPSGWPGAGPAQTINEAGLRATGATPSLVTYKGFNDIVKDNTFRLDLSWTLTFSYAG